MCVRAKTVTTALSSDVGYTISDSILGSFLIFNICHDFKLFFPLWSIFLYFYGFSSMQEKVTCTCNLFITF